MNKTVDKIDYIKNKSFSYDRKLYSCNIKFAKESEI